MPQIDSKLLQQSPAQNKQFLLDAAHKVEIQVMLPLQELAHYTQFHFDTVQENFNAQVDVLEGTEDIEVSENGEINGLKDSEAEEILGTRPLGLGLKKLLLVLAKRQKDLKSRLDKIQDKFNSQKENAEVILTHAIKQRAKLSQADDMYRGQLEEWSHVISRLGRQVQNLKQLSRPNPNLQPMNHTALNLTSPSAELKTSFGEASFTRTPVRGPPLHSTGDYHQGGRIFTPYRNSASLGVKKGFGGTPVKGSGGLLPYYTPSPAAGSKRPGDRSVEKDKNVHMVLSIEDQKACEELLDVQSDLLEEAEAKIAGLENKLKMLKIANSVQKL